MSSLMLFAWELSCCTFSRCSWQFFSVRVVGLVPTRYVRKSSALVCSDLGKRFFHCPLESPSESIAKYRLMLHPVSGLDTLFSSQDPEEEAPGPTVQLLTRRPETPTQPDASTPPPSGPPAKTATPQPQWPIQRSDRSYNTDHRSRKECKLDAYSWENIAFHHSRFPRSKNDWKKVAYGGKRGRED